MMSRFAVAAACVLSGCYPTLPPHLAEGTEVLRPGGVAATFAGGASALDVNCCKKGELQTVGGVEARVRVGIGAKQEVGGSVLVGMGSTVAQGDVMFGFGGKLSYKVAPLPWLAFVAGGGLMVVNAAAVGVFGADAAVIAAPYTAKNGMQLYTGARGALAVPVLEHAHATTEGVTFPLGLAIPASKRVRLFVEAGPTFGFTQHHYEVVPGASASSATLGAYAVAALAYTVR